MKLIMNILLVFVTLTVFSQTENEVKVFNLMNQVRQNPTNNPVVVALDSAINFNENKLNSLNKRLIPVKIGNFTVKQKIDSVNILKNIDLVKVYLSHLYNTKEFLKKQTPLKAFTFDKTMYDAYKKYDLSKTKGAKHTDVGPDVRKSENMVVLEKNPVDAVLNLIVDFPYDFNKKGHRDNIFSTTHTKTCVVENTLSEVTYIQGFK